MRRRSRGLRIPHLPGVVSARRRRELAVVFALIFGSLGAGSRLAAVQVPFTTRPSISTSAEGTRSLYAADIDGDGDLDALSASFDVDEISWYENVDGDGSSWVEEVVTTEADSASSVFAADVDGDGDLDILSSSTADDSITWYENEGGGSGWDAFTISSTADGATSVFAGDVDSDGDMDVLSSSNVDDKVAWYENEDGAGTSWTARTIAIGTSATGVSNPFSVLAADIDADGDLDAAAVSLGDDKIVWYENASASGDGTSWTQHNVFTSADGPHGVAAADVDGDGDLDLVSGSRNDDRVRWHRNSDGLGESWLTSTISTFSDETQHVFAADVDGDGDVDVLAASRADDEIAWSENVVGNGSAWITRTLSTLADFAYAVFAADVDGDGDVDALSASRDDDEIAWYENRTIHRSALLEEAIFISTTVDGVQSAFAADVDGDGDVDAVSAAYNGDSIAWYENELGDGTSWTFRTIATAVAGAYSVFVADVDGDGDLDVLSASAYVFDTLVSWYENEAGDGTSWTPRTIATDANTAVSVFAADVDGDGDLDAVSTALQFDEVVWHENELGDGTSWTSHTITTASDSPRSVFAADVDGDGDLDLLVASGYDDKIAWYENLGGDGASWIPSTISTAADGAVSVFAADVDGDGDLDALSASSSDNAIAWYENESGNGTSWTARTIATAQNAKSVFATDVDGDGDVDVLSGAAGLNEIAWYENLVGDGTSWSARTIATDASFAISVLAADMDGDGDVDALSASRSDDTIAWYPNRGGQFALPTTSLAQGVLGNSQEKVVLQIDLEHRGRAGDSDVVLDTLELLFEDGSGVPLNSGQANALIERIDVFTDDGSGTFEDPGDTFSSFLLAFSLVDGVELVPFLDDPENRQVAFGASKRFFLVVTMTVNAASETPHSFEIFHLTEASSTARDASTPTIPLRLEFHADTSTGLVDTELSTATCKAPFELDLRGFLVTGGVICEAGTTLTAGNGLIVGQFGHLTLRAGQQIRFVSDFSVKSAGSLATEIDPSLEP